MLIVILFLTLPLITYSVRHKGTTVDIKLRIEYLKHQVQSNFKNTHMREGNQDVENDDQRILENEQYDYVEEGNLPITPPRDDQGHTLTIGEYLPRLNTPSVPSSSVVVMESKLPLRTGQRFTIGKSAVAGFFRRFEYCELKWPASAWMHCQDLITPFLKGIRTNITVTTTLKLMNKDKSITKFFDLIRMNTTGLDDAEHEGILAQISQEQVRLFQWSANAIQLLLDILTKGKDHSFEKLKFGVKKWLTTHIRKPPTPEEMLKSAKLFRPPCITSATIEGPTSGQDMKTTHSKEIA